MPPLDDTADMNEGAARVSILQAIAARADEVAAENDAASPVEMSDLERVARLLEDAGRAATVLRWDVGSDVDSALLRLGAGVLLWLEAREADRRAA